MRLWTVAIVVGLAATLTVAGCGSAGKAGGAAGKNALRVGVVFDSGGRGDRSFNDSAWSGIERAEKDYGIDVKAVDSRSEKDFEANQRALADAGYQLIFAVGNDQQKALEDSSKDYPNVKFAIVDAVVDAPNVRSLLFKEEEGSFLAGYLAGLMSKTGKAGFVGGMEIPLIKKFEVGYAAGVATASESVQVLPAKYVGDWNSQDTAKVAANELFGSGADIVYHAAGRAGLGVIAAARDRGLYAIGVDGDQDGEAEGHVLTSMIKHVDAAVYDTIGDVVRGKFTGGQKIYDLKAGGVGLSEMRFTRDKVGPANLAKIDEVKKRIADGEIKVPSTQDELNIYLAILAGDTGVARKKS